MRAVEHAFALPERRRAYVAASALPSGPELTAGVRLWDSSWSVGALGAWASTSWRSWDPTAGLRAEVRF